MRHGVAILAIRSGTWRFTSAAHPHFILSTEHVYEESRSHVLQLIERMPQLTEKKSCFLSLQTPDIL